MRDYKNMICFDCANKVGLTLKEGALGALHDTCGICHKWRPCTDLHNDWVLPKKEMELNK